MEYLLRKLSGEILTDKVSDISDHFLNIGGHPHLSTWPLHMDLNLGFWCVNSEHTNGCPDFEVELCCPKSQLGTCPQGYSWTTWTDTDDPSGTGDWEPAHKQWVKIFDPI